MSNESIPPPDDDYISLQQACAIFDVSRGTLWTWTRTRGLPKYRLGQKTYFRRAEIRKLIQEGLVK